MSRRMSCSMTIDAVRSRRKTVTRRSLLTWSTLAAGDRLTLVERGMGLRRGERQVVLAEVEVVSVRLEPLLAGLSHGEIRKEGINKHMTPHEWAHWWADAHGVGGGDLGTVWCRRIEWVYLDEQKQEVSK